MNLMLVKGESSLGAELNQHLTPYGISVVHYRHPIKAMDNLQEVAPKIVLYDLQDFPRHWKIMIKYLRDEFPRDEVVFLLFTETKPPLEEANKALFLGVNGLLLYNGESTSLAKSIREIFLRYGSFDIPEGRAFLRGNPEKPLGFLFRHPRRKHLVTGALVHLEENWAIFKPDFGHEIVDLNAGDELFACSLRIQEALLTLNARIMKNTGQLHLEIQPVKAQDQKLLMEKLQDNLV